MPLYCETGKFAAICAGQAKMDRIDREVLDLALDLVPEIEAITAEGEIYLVVQNKWVSSIRSLRTKFRKKPKNRKVS